MTYAEAIHEAAEALEAVKVAYLRGLLAQTKGNVRQAARLAGVNRTHFYELLKAHGLNAEIQGCRPRPIRWRMAELRTG